MCTVIGVLSFAGNTSSREYVGSGFAANASTTEICANLVAGYSNSVQATGENPSYPSDLDMCAHKSENTLLRSVNGSQVYCCHSGTSPVDGFVSFDDFGRGMFVVLQTMTIDGWNEIAWTTARTVGVVPAFAFYASVVLLGGFFVFQLFTSVICASLSDIKDEKAENDAEVKCTALERSVNETMASATGESVKVADWEAVSVLKSPTDYDWDETRGIFGRLKLLAISLVADERFEMFINLSIFCNVVAMMTRTAEANAELEAFRSNAEYVFFSIFCSELMIKHVALGIRTYWARSWNRLDGAVVLSGCVDMIMSAQGATGVNLSFLRIMRILRLFRVARVFRRSESFRKMIRAIISGTQRMWVFLLVWALCLSIFAVLGTQLFSARGNIDEERLNFRDFASSSLTLFVVSTGENTFEVAWSIMQAAGHPAGIYMIVWCLITTSILSVVLGILIESVTEDDEPIDVDELMIQSGGDVRLHKFTCSLAEEYGFNTRDIPSWFISKAAKEYKEMLSKSEKQGDSASEDELSDAYDLKEEDDAHGSHFGGLGLNPLQWREQRWAKLQRMRLVHEVAVVRHWLISLGYEQHTKRSLKVARGMRRQAVEKARARLSQGHELYQMKRAQLMERSSMRIDDSASRLLDRLQQLSLRCIINRGDDLYAGVDLAMLHADDITLHALYAAPSVKVTDELAEAGRELEAFVLDDNFKIALSFYDIDAEDESVHTQTRLKVLRLTKQPWFDGVILLLITA